MSSTTARRVVVAIPAKDEASCIDPCLAALARQTRKPDAVLLLPNNCTDDTAAVAAAMSSSLPYRLHIHYREFPLLSANAGTARRAAMQLAAELAGRDGILLTTDADTVVADDWIERNLQAISARADLVCGRVALDATEALLIPSHLHADDALECELTELLDRIAAELDPDPADPWPRHAAAAGASLAVTVAAFLRVGGIPALAAGEDGLSLSRWHESMRVFATPPRSGLQSPDEPSGVRRAGWRTRSAVEYGSRMSSPTAVSSLRLTHIEDSISAAGFGQRGSCPRRQEHS